MLMLFSPSASNMVAATPGLESMPEPTIETLERLSLAVTFFAPTVWQNSSAICIASSLWAVATVKLMSLVPSRPIDCRMMSTLILLAASEENSLKATPGRSGTSMTEIRTTSLSIATPLISIFSTLQTSLTSVPGTSLWMLERTSNFTEYFLAISTDRLCRTLAPQVASSSISS